MLSAERIALLKHGAPPRNALEAALRNAWGGGGASYEKTVGPAPIISVSDAKAKPAKSLIVGMEPIQAGSGDPSPDNIRPISGRTGVTVTRTGKNLFDKNNYGELDAYMSGSSFIASGSHKTVYIPCKPNTNYVFTNSANNRKGVSWTDTLPTIGGTYYGVEDTGIITTGATAKYLVCYCFNSLVDSVTFQQVLDSIQIELGSTASPYEPYTGQSYPVTWQTEAGTVYGGTVDVVSGELTVDRAGLDLGTLTYSKSSIVTNGFVATGGVPNDFPLYTSSSDVPNWLCSQYKITSNNDLESASVDFAVAWRISGQNKGVIVKDSNYASYYTGNDMASFKTAMSGVMLVYYMTEPQTYQLTPTQIQMLKGADVLWSDADDLTLTYIGTEPANLLGGMLGNPQEPIEETSEEPTEGEDE